MHTHIKKLYEIANKPERLIIGLMSGTSLDGLDVALCRVKGQGTQTILDVVHFTTVPYTPDYKTKIKNIFSKRDVDLQNICLLNPWVGNLHGEMILSSLNEWGIEPQEVDLIASHGQTIYHCPKSLHNLEGYTNATLQIGDGDHIAFKTGIITCSDFRQKHIAAGGEGAPLAVYGDFLLFSNEQENRIMLNLGGIANLTYLPKSRNAMQVFSTDIGPGNTIMDAFIQKEYPGKYFDKNAEIALTGTVNHALLSALKKHVFFDQSLPKTTGPELFNLEYLENAQSSCDQLNLSNNDILATLNLFSADMVVHALGQCAEKLDDYEIYCSGGGIANPLLMKNLAKALPNKLIKSTNDLNIDPDAKEAVLFAVLANECVSGGQTQIGNMEEGIPSVSMGKLSFSD